MTGLEFKDALNPPEASRMRPGRLLPAGADWGVLGDNVVGLIGVVLERERVGAVRGAALAKDPAREEREGGVETWPPTGVEPED